MTIPDVGEVKDGTECGLEQLCIDRKCVNISSLKGTCSTNDCNMRGICNNKQHCHCHFGWDPPNCLKNGSGGSVDSGPPSERKGEVAQRVVQKRTRIPYFPMLLVPFFLLFCLFILLGNWPKLSPKKEKPNVQTSPKRNVTKDITKK
jgi:hypothetical protein